MTTYLHCAKVVLLGFLWIQSCYTLPAQNLEEISLKKSITVTGNINLNTVGYAVDGIEGRRDPFNWFLSGGLNFNVFGYSVPLSFSYSNANKSFSQPFNQFSFSPQYKWVKTYIGYNSMTFSPYTLSGHVFYGGGVELTPGRWRIAAMYGRLRKAVPFNLSDTLQYTNASFKRMGYGLKIGYETNGDAVSFNVFTAKDDPESIPYALPENKITPQQNVAMGLSGRKRLFDHFFVDVEYAISVLNTNTLANAEEGDTINVKETYNLIQGLLPQNSTTRYFDAISAGVGYQGSQYTVQVKYERIAPEYQTLGAYYFNNDMRNITVVFNTRLINNKVTLGTNIGLQENNLDRSRASTTQRTVGAANIQFTPNEDWNIAGSYSNFLSFTNVRSQADPFYKNTLDTLNFYQVSQTMTGTVTRRLGTKERPQSIMFNTSYQRASNKASNDPGAQLSDFMSANASYNCSITPSNLTLAIGANIYKNNAAGIGTLFFGPTINAAKTFLDKTLRTSFVTAYNHTTGDGISTSPVWNNNISLSYSPKEKEDSRGRNNFSFSLNVLRRLKAVGEQPAFTEFTGTLNYSYSF